MVLKLLSNMNSAINNWSGATNANPYTGTMTTSESGMKGMITDFGKATKNIGLMVKMRFPYYSDDGVIKIPDEQDWITGFLVDGFGWSIENEYENLLEVTQAQKNLSKVLAGGGQFADMLPDELQSQLTAIQAIQAGKNKAVMSLQQTMSVWTGMKKPTFSIKVLFFDGEGTDATDVMRVAYILERIQYPYIPRIAPVGGVNIFMQAPCGYHPNSEADSGENSINKTYNFSADGTGEIHIGNYMHFPEVICTGVSFQLSDKILYNGKPQWLYVTLNFAYWRQPVLEDLKDKYGW